MSHSDYSYAQSTAVIAGHPIHAMLVPFPVVCFTLALLTDIAYWRTSNLMWTEFSAWLLLGGIALVLAFLNNLVHAADGWTSVVPWGLTLSALTVLVLLVTGWLGGTLVHVHGVGVRRHA